MNGRRAGTVARPVGRVPQCERMAEKKQYGQGMSAMGREQAQWRVLSEAVVIASFDSQESAESMATGWNHGYPTRPYAEFTVEPSEGPVQPCRGR